MRVWLVGVFLVGAACGTSADELAQRANPGDAEVRKLLQVTGSGRLTLQAMATLSASARKDWPQVPDYIWAEILDEFKEEDVVDFLVPIYRKHFSDQDIQELLKFYESPIGRKLLQEQPQVMQESLAASQPWAQRCFDRAWNRLRARGYAPKPRADRENEGRRRTRG